MAVVSVVTVCRNHRSGLQRTLESTEAQSDARDLLEMVVVDGASTDDTPKLLEHYAPDNEFKYVSEPDTGIYQAMNKGIRMSTGRLVLFMNAGDTFAGPNVIREIVEAAEDSKWRWGYGCARTISKAGELINVISHVPFRLDRLAAGLVTVPHQATVMSRELLVELGGFKESFGLAADQELILRAGIASDPYLWGSFFADFEGGGVGSSRGPSEYVRDMRRARAAAGVAIGRSTLVDWAFTTGLVVGKNASFLQHLMRKRARWHGSGAFAVRRNHSAE